jgi:hypothetical protein
VKCKYGKEEVVKAQIDWVEGNFMHGILSTVQVVAHQKITQVKTDNPANTLDDKKLC